MGMYLGGQKVSPIIKSGVVINNQDKIITENGIYTADAGYTGLGEVTVNVSGGGGEGISREVSANGVYQIPVTSFTFSLPSNATDVGNNALQYAFQGCIGLTSLDLSSLTTVSGTSAMSTAFNGCTALTVADLSNLTTINGTTALIHIFRDCTALTSVDLSSLTTISGNSAMGYAFNGCRNLVSIDFTNLTTISSTTALDRAFGGCTKLTSITFPSLTTISGARSFVYTFQNCKLTSVTFPSLKTISGDSVMIYTFSGCTSLTSLSFPLLTSTSFGSYTTQFNNMLSGVTGCVVHFPSNLQSVIGSWSSVTAGFGGTNTTVLFDLPATE